MSIDRRDEQSDERFARDAARLLQKSAEDLDVATLERLHRARRKALDALDRESRPAAWVTGWRPAIGVAAAVIIAIALWMNFESAPRVAPQSPAPAVAEAERLEIELMLADENAEVIADLDFYTWLETSANNGNGTEAQPSG